MRTLHIVGLQHPEPDDERHRRRAQAHPRDLDVLVVRFLDPLGDVVGVERAGEEPGLGEPAAVDAEVR